MQTNLVMLKSVVIVDNGTGIVSSDKKQISCSLMLIRDTVKIGRLQDYRKEQGNSGVVIYMFMIMIMMMALQVTYVFLHMCRYICIYTC